MGYSPWGHKESDTTEHFHFGRRLQPEEAGLGALHANSEMWSSGLLYWKSPLIRILSLDFK